MTKIVVHRNSTGYGPYTRPELKIGEIVSVEFSDTGKVVQYLVRPWSGDGSRCPQCDMRDRWDCMMNNGFLPSCDVDKGSTCTIKWSSKKEDRVLAVFTNIEKMLDCL